MDNFLFSRDNVVRIVHRTFSQPFSIVHFQFSIVLMLYCTNIIFLVLAGAVLVWLLFEIATFPNISKLREENPTTTSMIEYRISQAQADGREPRKFMIWLPIEQISPNLQKAVMAGEDARFFQ